MTKDYYKILGVAEFDSAENIKTAYRKLVRKYHPDIAGNSQENILRFKEVTEAYETLSNQVKKAEYDRAKRFYDYAYSKDEKKEETVKNSTNPQNKQNNFRFNWDDFIGKKNVQKSFKNQEIKAPVKGKDVYTDIEISVFEAISGTNKIINMLETTSCPKCNGRKFVNGGRCCNCNGKGEINNYKKFNVKIPANIKNGSKIRLAGEGSKGLYGGVNGDLYLTIHINETKEYKTDGLNILKSIEISPAEAVLGTRLKISTLNGNINLKIAPRTQNGQKIRLSGCGLVQNNNIGDMIVTVEIKIPQNLSKEEIDLYRKLEKLSENVRNTDSL